MWVGDAIPMRAPRIQSVVARLSTMAAVGPVQHVRGPPPGSGAFVARIASDGAEARLEYSVAGGVMDMEHTVVPASARGKGVGALLADAAFAFAAAEHLSVRPSCSYIRDAYLPKSGQAAGFRVDPTSGLAVPLH